MLGENEDMTLVRFIARPMLATVFISGGVNAVKNPGPLAARAKPVIDRIQPRVDRQLRAYPIELDATRLVQLNGIIDVLAGSLLATGNAPRLASLTLAGTLVPTTLGGHRFWEETDPKVRAAQRMHFMKNVSLIGALLIASVDTAGKPSLAWLAKRQAKVAKKKAQDLTSS